MSEEKKLSANEYLKIESNYLRGTLAEELADTSTGGITEGSGQMVKFHGCYVQDDRDLRANRRKHKLEKAYSFLMRVRLPGGVVSPKQWLHMDWISENFANNTLKLTTRQAFQLHGVIKSQLKRTVQEMDKVALDCIAACGDVNRNVMVNPNPHLSAQHADTIKLATEISEHLLPQGGAYHEIFLDQEKVISSEEVVEPIYGKTYLPRKFKIAIVIPPSNDCDIHANDLSFIAIVEDEKIVGYNIAVGGGMGMTHGVENTYPRLADIIGFCTPEQVVDVAEKVLLVQRDNGNRCDRKQSRLKYTIDSRSTEWFVQTLNEYLGYEIAPVRPYEFTTNGDNFGWHQDETGNWHLNLFIEGGRVVDSPAFPVKTGLREIAKVLKGEFRLTANQNLAISNIPNDQKAEIEVILEKYNILKSHERSALRLYSIACVSLPTCGLALAEAERYLPVLVTELEEVVEECGLRHDAITIRMTGCPNGCGRPFLSEIAFVGRGPGRYNLYLGGGHAGQRLNKLYRQDILGVDAKEILKPLIEDYAKNRQDGERFGDFVIRAGYVEATVNGLDFHKNIKPEAIPS